MGASSGTIASLLPPAEGTSDAGTLLLVLARAIGRTLGAGAPLPADPEGAEAPGAGRSASDALAGEEEDDGCASGAAVDRRLLEGLLCCDDGCGSLALDGSDDD
jgi:hypothetical protein